MHPIRLIATDLDGTFLAHGDTPHPDNIRMVQTCRAHGIRVCACSGRPFVSMRTIVRQAGLDDLCITTNGAAIVDAATGQMHYQNRFAPQMVKQLVEACLPLGCWRIDITGQKGMYIYQVEGNPPQDGHMSPEELAHTFYFTDLEAMIGRACEDAERISLGMRALDGMRLNTVYATCHALTPVEVLSPDLRFIEIMPINANKATAVSILSERYGCKPENVLALGDGFNDLHMLLWAGTGVAMGNADPRLKAVADMTTDTNVRAGFAKAVAQVLFTKWDRQ